MFESNVTVSTVIPSNEMGTSTARTSVLIVTSVGSAATLAGANHASTKNEASSRLLILRHQRAMT